MKTYLKPSSEDFIARIILLLLGVLSLFIGFCLIPYVGGYTILMGGVMFFNYAIFFKPVKIRFKK